MPFNGVGWWSYNITDTNIVAGWCDVEEYDIQKGDICMGMTILLSCLRESYAREWYGIVEN